MIQHNIFISLIFHELLKLATFGYRKSMEYATNIKLYIITQYILITVTCVEAVGPKQ